MQTPGSVTVTLMLDGLGKENEFNECVPTFTNIVYVCKSYLIMQWQPSPLHPKELVHFVLLTQTISPNSLDHD